jgi:hypothetical protein
MEENGRWITKLTWVVLGVIIGVVLVLAGALNAFFVALFILAGWLIGKYVAGEIDLDGLYDRYLRGRTKGSRK